jgi:hypothetical protein
MRFPFTAALVTVSAATACFAQVRGAATGPEVELLASLYRSYAWEVVIDEPLPGTATLLEQPASELGRFFTPQLVALLRKDRECAARTREICRLDFSPIWAAQDPRATELRVYRTQEPNKVRVQFKTAPQGNVSVLIYKLAQTAAGLRIDDIEYESGTSLSRLLQAEK